MFKKFFVAVILGLLVMSSQIVSAADIDWNSAPRINSKAQLATYIEEGRLKGQTKFYFTFPSVKINNEQERKDFQGELVKYIATAPSAKLDVDGGFGTGRYIYTIYQEYLGARVANAYLSRNQQQAWMNLTPEEQKLYNIAVGIVYEANKRSSEIEKARYIHDFICDSVYEYKNENNRNETAIGALIDHYAQCGGYSDAFYMLGRMAGFKVRSVGGKFGDGWHFWNTITLSDGRSYCIDVTMDDGYNTDEWFLANFEVMKRHHSCDWSVIPNLQ